MPDLDELGSALIESLNPDAPTPAEEIPAEEEEVLPIEGEEIPAEEEEEEGKLPGEGDEEILPDQVDIKEFAEMAGLEVSELYNNLTMKNSKGEVVTLGELKDQFQGNGVDGLSAQKAELIDRQQRFTAEVALQDQFGQPVAAVELAMTQLAERFKSTDWGALAKEYGDKAELAKLQMQQRYSELQVELNQRKGEYGQAINNMQDQISNSNAMEILSVHPDWKDPEVSRVALTAMHEPLGDIISLEEMTQIIGQMGAKALRIFERAATGKTATSINTNKVRKAAKTLLAGKTVAPAQRTRDKQGKFLAKAKGGTRSEQTDAAVRLIAEHGGF